ncbi:hypothetical protein Pint_34624 [Pistacia integerrima]|uniref:Uncharacterized protein n=1 Tax=Pistacia integerrima TaxID=434235 RepID=A0ACC0X6S3_9ROSI|nr:hypothetical protein Pint_34624 [Pistacia integerrima]
MGNMKASTYALSIQISLLLLFASSIDGRKDMGEYWRDVVQDQSVSESVEISLVSADPTRSLSNEKPEHRAFDIELSPDVSIYHDDIKPTKEKIFVKNFEPRPDVSIYHNDIKPTKENSFVKNFEPRPDVSIYHDNIKPEQKSFVKDFESKPQKSFVKDFESKPQKSFVKDFESKPDVSIYHNDIKPTTTKEKLFIKYFEPRPDVSIYDNGVKATGKNFPLRDIESSPDATIYVDSSPDATIYVDSSPDATIYVDSSPDATIYHE